MAAQKPAAEPLDLKEASVSTRLREFDQEVGTELVNFRDDVGELEVALHEVKSLMESFRQATDNELLHSLQERLKEVRLRLANLSSGTGFDQAESIFSQIACLRQARILREAMK